jgi:hypothetical protein
VEDGKLRNAQRGADEFNLHFEITLTQQREFSP